MQFIKSLVVVLLAIPGLLRGQSVKTGKVVLGVTETQVREALGAGSPHYLTPLSEVAGVRYLVAETLDRSCAFTLTDYRFMAFSLHQLPPEQQRSLAPGQEPTVKVFRDLLIQQAWAPAAIQGGSTYWASNKAASPMTDVAACPAASPTAWQPLGALPGANGSTTAGLVNPALVSYPDHCGVTLHLNEDPAATE